MPPPDSVAGATYFKRVFGFLEGDYVTTRAVFLRLCRFETRNGRECCVFTIPATKATLDAGWHYSPSVAELRQELTEAVRAFHGDFPGYLTALKAPERLQGLNREGVDSSTPLSAVGVSLLPIAHILGVSGDLHERYRNGVFQAASQFNLLEFVSSSLTPEIGVGVYMDDHTQGPDCAMACIPATAYRNYLMHPDFVREGALRETCTGVAPLKPLPVCAEEEVNAHRGQTCDSQADMLRDFTRRLTDSRKGGTHPDLPRLPYDHFYEIRNGYYHSKMISDLPDRLRAIASFTRTTVDAVIDDLSDHLRIGVVQKTVVSRPLQEVTVLPQGQALHTVTQTFNSALSLDSSTAAKCKATATLAQSVLSGSYEGTLLAGALHTLDYLRQMAQQGSQPIELPPIFLTKVGGGVFNNKDMWINAAIERGVIRVMAFEIPLDIRLVHFRGLEAAYLQ